MAKCKVRGSPQARSASWRCCTLPAQFAGFVRVSETVATGSRPAARHHQNFYRPCFIRRVPGLQPAMFRPTEADPKTVTGSVRVVGFGWAMVIAPFCEHPQAFALIVSAAVCWQGEAVPHHTSAFAPARFALL